MNELDADVRSFYMNPQAYSHVKPENKKADRTKRSGKTEFSRIFDTLRGDSNIGPLEDLPVSEETVNLLMDEVRNAGDSLRNRPFPAEIIIYKQAVRNFMHYVVENCYKLEHEAGIPKFLRPGYKGPRGTSEAMKHITYTKIQVIDKKLEDLAAILLSSQMPQIELTSRLEEIKGLLVDLLQ
jgi:uncharacterized protein YaaR (DUF327 family)